MKMDDGLRMNTDHWMAQIGGQDLTMWAIGTHMQLEECGPLDLVNERWRFDYRVQQEGMGMEERGPSDRGMDDQMADGRQR